MRSLRFFPRFSRFLVLAAVAISVIFFTAAVVYVLTASSSSHRLFSPTIQTSSIHSAIVKENYGIKSLLNCIVQKSERSLQTGTCESVLKGNEYKTQIIQGTLFSTKTHVGLDVRAWKLFNDAAAHASGRDGPQFLVPPIRFLINQPDLCAQPAHGVRVLFVVCVGIEQVFQRKAIRDTWGSRDILNRWNAQLFFLVGMRSGKRLWKALLSESRAFGDIIQENFVESYDNLTSKSISMLKWVRDYCPNVDFVAKVDGDVYVNVEVAIATLSNHRHKQFAVLGHVYENAPIDRDRYSRYFIPRSELSGKFYPKYVSGALYFITRDLVSALYNAAVGIPLIKMEDVYITGLCAAGVRGVVFVNLSGVAFGRRPVTRCAYRDAVSGHRVKPLDMYSIHKQLYNRTAMC